MANAVSVPNPVKELLKAGRVALGMNVRLARSGDIARIAKTTGHDFIFIDDRNIPRQMQYIQKGARFITTNSEIAFIMAEASRVTAELRKALAEK